MEEVFFSQFVKSGSPGPRYGYVDSFLQTSAEHGMITRRPRLFHFLHGKNDADPRNYPSETELVTVHIGSNAADDNNDLISCLSAQLSAPIDQPTQQEHIFEPSDVVAFELSGNYSRSTTFGGGLTERKAFKYPKHIYLDQFLQVNVELANGKRAEQREMADEVGKLLVRRKSLASFEVSVLIFCSGHSFYSFV